MLDGGHCMGSVRFFFDPRQAVFGVRGVGFAAAVGARSRRLLVIGRPSCLLHRGRPLLDHFNGFGSGLAAFRTLFRLKFRPKTGTFYFIVRLESAGSQWPTRRAGCLLFLLIFPPPLLFCISCWVWQPVMMRAIRDRHAISVKYSVKFTVKVTDRWNKIGLGW